MITFFGKNITKDITIHAALQHLYGLGNASAFFICKKVGVSPRSYLNKLNDLNMLRIKQFVEDRFCIRGTLQQNVYRNIKRLIQINCYRGLRHRVHLPVRGQRTRTNAQTCKRVYITIKK